MIVFLDSQIALLCMLNGMNSFVTFFVENFPNRNELSCWFLPLLLWAYGCLFLAGYFKRNKGLQTGYTRKIFHFLIFTSAAAIQAMWGLRTLCLFGAATSSVIFYAILRGTGHPLYEAIAREKDAPHRTYYILAPYFATFLGGITSNVLFSDSALVGYLVTGLGDAIGEPVGTRFGKHTYRVPSLFTKIPSTRSYEGSTAVFVVSFLAIIVAVTLSPELGPKEHSFFTGIGIALISTFLEALSPHGWDNAVMQVIPSWCAALFL